MWCVNAAIYFVWCYGNVCSLFPVYAWVLRLQISNGGLVSLSRCNKINSSSTLQWADSRKHFRFFNINLLNPTGHVMHQQFNIQQPYALPTLYLCVLYLSENKQRLVPLRA